MILAGCVVMTGHVYAYNVLHVWTNSPSPEAPFGSWETAARDIQTAIDHAQPGDLVWVTNGIYDRGGRVAVGSLTNRIAVTNEITVQSVNGPDYTVIFGNNINEIEPGPSSFRCAYVGHHAVLAGFRLEHGIADQGAGIWAESSAVISNCVIFGCYASGEGGGVYGGRLIDCSILQNMSERDGGGVVRAHVQSCLVQGNFIYSTIGYEAGGGVYECTVYDSLIEENWAFYGGGAARSMLWRSTLRRNNPSTYRHVFGPAPAGGGAWLSTLYNCVIEDNGTYDGGGVSYCSVYNSLLVGNSAYYYGGGSYGSFLSQTVVANNRARFGGGVVGGSNVNSIVYNNHATAFSNHYFSTILYSCSAPLPRGAGNISLPPGMVSPGYLAENSPCRGAGNIEFTEGFDLDGRPWNDPPSMGCREYLPALATGALAVTFLAEFPAVVSGYPLEFASQIDGEASAMTWDFGDGSMASNTPWIAHTYEVPGDYTVELRAFSPMQPDGVATTLTVHVSPPVIYYVDATSSNPIAPFASWSSAATQVADAVSAAVFPGAVVLVAEGDYPLHATLRVTNPISVRSISGPETTRLIAGSTNFQARLVHVGDRAVLDGFTLSDSLGGGLSADRFARIYRCVISNNVADTGGGVLGGMLFDCRIVNNRARYGGGGVVCSGVYRGVVADNGAASQLVMQGGGALDSALINAIIKGNSASDGGGACASILLNCTVVSNRAVNGFGGGTERCGNFNSIILDNTVHSHGNILVDNGSGGSFFNCCIWPLPGGYENAGNFTNAPLFVGENDYRLSEASPCRDTGSNAYVDDPFDLAGNPRVMHVAVDVGAYEYQGPGPADTDGDGIPNWWEVDRRLDPFMPNLDSTDGDWMTDHEEYVADTNPRDPASNLAMGIAATDSDSPMITVAHTSTARIYEVWVNTNLMKEPQAWMPLHTGLWGVGSAMALPVDAHATTAHFRTVVRLP